MTKNTIVASALAAGAAAVLALALPLAAHAHSFLVASNPVADSTITEVPDSFSVTTDEALLDLSGNGNGFAIQVIDQNGLYYGDGCTVVSRSTLSSGATLGEAGPYRFLWQVVSADGHTVSGELGFTWAPGADAVISPGSAAPPGCGEPVVEATATASPSPGPTADSTADSTAEQTAGDDGTPPGPSPALWIGVVGALVAAGVTLLVLRRRRAS